MNTSTIERPLIRVPIESELDIVAAVLAARDRDLPVRAVGSGGSKSPCYRTDGMALSLEDYDRVVDIDGRRVTVQAGMTVGQLNGILEAHGLALPTHGEWAGATVAGAISSGTHGGSSYHGIFPTSVSAMRLVTSAGRVLEVDRDHPLFPHAAVSFGSLGIISTITFECVERFHLEMVMRAVPFRDYMREHETWNRDHEFFAAVWFPAAQRVLTFAANRVPAPRQPARRRERFCPSTFVMHKLSSTLGISAIHDGWFTATAVDTCDRILSPIRDRSQRVQMLRFLSRGWKAAELAVPASSAGAALERLDRFLRTHRHTLTNPVGLRSSAADDFSLSPCAGRPAFWIDLFYRPNETFTRALRREVEELDTRCHWGKHIALSPAYLRRQYPRWDEFRATRAALDPTGTFSNAFTRSFDL